MPRISIMIGAAALALVAPAAAQAPTNGVEALAWMAGRWVAETGERWTEEHWTDARGGAMFGIGRSGEGATATNYEYMRIAADGAGVVSFWGSPGGKPAVAFKLVSITPGRAVFENTAHDFPTRIEYRRTGDEMVATVSGPSGAGAMNWRFRRVD